MFVSSYGTYIGTNTVDKTEKYKKEDGSLKDSFSDLISKENAIKPYLDQTFPVNYISNYKSFANQQKLKNQTKTKDELKIIEIITTTTAKSAYGANSKLFLPKKPYIALDLTPKIDKKAPLELREAKENDIRRSMINTYISNDRYFRVNAA